MSLDEIGKMLIETVQQRDKAREESTRLQKEVKEVTDQLNTYEEDGKYYMIKEMSPSFDSKTTLDSKTTPIK